MVFGLNSATRLGSQGRLRCRLDLETLGSLAICRGVLLIYSSRRLLLSHYFGESLGSRLGQTLGRCRLNRRPRIGLFLFENFVYLIRFFLLSTCLALVIGDCPAIVSLQLSSNSALGNITVSLPEHEHLRYKSTLAFVLEVSLDT